MRFRVMSIVVVLLVSVTTSFAQDETIPRYEPLSTCPLPIPEGVDYECGQVIVPEFHGLDSGRTITLTVIRLLSSSESPDEPMFLGVGGPGGDGLAQGVIAAGQLAIPDSSVSKLLATRDLVYFSQRGSAYSEPQLTCSMLEPYIEAVTSGTATAESLRQIVSDSLVNCYNGFVEAGLDFRAYNSLENAADINSIREVLGYDQIVYYGQSYGTLLGQHLLRDFPETLAAVILDGVVPIDAVVYEEKIDERFQLAMEPLLNLCAADAACSEAHPNLADDLERVYQALQAEPFEYITPNGFSLPIDGVTFATAAFGSLYSSVTFSDIPLAVDAVQNPDTIDTENPAINRFFTGAVPADESFARMMHFAIVCAEDPIYSAEDSTSLGSPALSMYAAFAEADASDYVMMCDLMDLPVLPDETDALVSSDVPVMLLHGAFDPATPEPLVAHIMDAFTTSYAFIFPYGGHVQNINGLCEFSIVSQFLTDPTTEPDASCIASAEPPQFGVPEE